MKVRRSSGSLEGFSTDKKAMRAVPSGTTTAISDPLKPTRDNTWPMIDRAAVMPSTLPSGDGEERRLSGSSAANTPVMLLRREFTPATITCFDVNSQAHSGACGLKTSVTLSARPLLNECNLVDFLQRGDARKDLLQRVVAQEGHALFVRHLLDFRRRPSLDDHF